MTRFSPRPGTRAARLPPLRPGLLKRRSRELTELRLRTARDRLETWIGSEAVEVLVAEHGPGGTSMARAPNYLPVVLPYRAPLGSWISTRIDGARSNFLIGSARGHPIPEPAPTALEPLVMAGRRAERA